MGDPLSFGVLLRLVLSFGAVVGGLLALRWWSRRGMTGTRAGIRILARTSLGRNAAVHVVEVGSKRYLLGSSEQSVSMLGELPPDDDLDHTSPTGGPTQAFGGSNPRDTSGDRTPGGLHLSAATPADVFDLVQRTTPPTRRPRNGLLQRLQRMTTRSTARGPFSAPSH